VCILVDHVHVLREGDQLRPSVLVLLLLLALGVGRRWRRRRLLLLAPAVVVALHQRRCFLRVQTLVLQGAQRLAGAAARGQRSSNAPLCFGAPLAPHGVATEIYGKINKSMQIWNTLKIQSTFSFSIDKNARDNFKKV
jgi:hypothetical protein